MVIGLFGLALVMIVGGVASVVQGFPYVRLESGLAMVISGTSAASAGAILLGLAAAVARLKRLEEAVRSTRPASALAFPQPMREIAPAPATGAPALAGAAGLAGVTLGAAGVAHPTASDEAVPELSVGANDRIAATGPEDGAEPPLPNLLPPVESHAPSLEQHAPDLEVERDEPRLEPAIETHEERAQEELSLRPSVEHDQAATVPPEPVEEAPKEDLQVVGTYASGGNTYVMYSNGSIEADTPKGRFTFGSLDELKAFVAAGGESGSRGAP